MPTYNTVMAVAAGAGLLTMLVLGWRLMKGTPVEYRGFALTFGVIGFILTATGLHMTLTWPFAKYFPFDNIIFGEPSLAFGVLLLAASILLWRRAEALELSSEPASDLARTAEPFSILILGFGLSLIAIAVAGVNFQLFAAPPEEPISGAFAQWPWVEAIFMSGLFALVGFGAAFFPLAIRSFHRRDKLGGWQWVVGILWLLGGLAFFLFGALNYFTHIGLILNTMPSGG